MAAEEPLTFFAPLHTPEETPHALARCVLNLVGTGADFDLLPVDESPGPAKDVGTARVIVRTDGYVVEGSSGGTKDHHG